MHDKFWEVLCTVFVIVARRLWLLQLKMSESEAEASNWLWLRTWVWFTFGNILVGMRMTNDGHNAMYVWCMFDLPDFFDCHILDARMYSMYSKMRVVNSASAILGLLSWLLWLRVHRWWLLISQESTDSRSSRGISSTLKWF